MTTYTADLLFTNHMPQSIADMDRDAIRMAAILALGTQAHHRWEMPLLRLVQLRPWKEIGRELQQTIMVSDQMNPYEGSDPNQTQLQGPHQ